jgi:proteasome accessory factor C
MAARQSPGTARDQVARMLALVPYLHAAGDGAGEVRVEDAARALGVSPEQVGQDLRVLFMCGLPGGYPDDLIDVDIDALEDGVIRVSNADYLTRPVRFAPAEATALVVALRALADGAPAETADVVRRTLAKIEDAVGDSAASRVHLVDRGERDLEATAELLQGAVDAARQVRLTYYVPTRDEQSDRVVDPWHLHRTEGVAYLDSWCHAAGGERVFRLDRVLAAEVLDTPVEHVEPTTREREAGWFDSPSRVTLLLAPDAAWMPEYYPVLERRDHPDGSLEVDLEVADAAWLHQLLLRLAPHASVVAPPEFAESFTALLREALSLYPGSA